ncbi:uncharacterized protein LOC133832774 [Humulus lupulus]|uniref:uncharacterized protein LOC133832774 n=1 Tax=Humulus lupulus TaxID=3486 RepID=UPI002B41732F|nr:uncharacterized protein LOC133832774 [Humulus lupulus]
MRKSATEAYKLFEKMAANSYQWTSERFDPKKVESVLELDLISALAVQTLIQSQATSLRRLENQVSQLASSLNSRPQGSVPNNIEANPNGDKEQCKAVTLRNSRELASEGKKPKVVVKAVENETRDEKKISPPKTMINQEEKSPYNYAPPFPQCLQKQKLGKQFSEFLEVFKTLHLNIPSAEALEKMPIYVKFMKDILSKKKKLGDFETVSLTQKFSAIFKKKLPPKLKDPGSFTIPYTIGTLFFWRALCDLGASINLMSFSIYQKLCLGEAKPTSVTLELANRSLTYPNGIVEDIWVNVEMFISLTAFIAFDMEEDREIPIIIGRPF